jgi:HAE1 family hydrophobic/amphiphilic exporter-1/multidrug efflux pump
LFVREAYGTIAVRAAVGRDCDKTGHIRNTGAQHFNRRRSPAATGYEFYIQNRGDGGSKRLNEVKDAFLARVNSDKELGGAQTLWHAAVPQLYVDVDRDKAKKVGVPIADIFAALSATMGTYYVNDFNKYGRTWQVLMSAEQQFRKKPDDITGVYVRAKSGDMVPLSSLVTIQYTSGPDSLDRLNNLPAVKIIDRRRRATVRPGHRAGRADRQGSAARRLQL